MAIVEQSIDVGLPLASVQEGWERFTEWVLIGKYRLVCDALSCERMADGKTVSFVGLDSRRSRVTVHFDFDDVSSPEPVGKLRRIATRLAQDLLYFRDYMETDLSAYLGRPAVRRDATARDDRAGRLRLTPDSLIERDHDGTLGSPHFLA